MTHDEDARFGGEYTLTMGQMLRDAIAWQQEVGDTEASEQEGLYRMIAREAGITDAEIGGPESVRHPAARIRAAADLTDLGSFVREQLAEETADMRAALTQAADGIRDIAERLGAAPVDPAAEFERARDPDLEEWLSHQLARATSQDASPADMSAVRQIAALKDGTVADAVGRWLREARAAGQ